MSGIKNETFKENAESFLTRWNIKFRYDRIWRKKYNIPFGSPEHLRANQIDIFLDLYEDQLYELAKEQYFQKQKDLEDYQKSGNVLKEEKMSQKEEDEIFKNFRFK